MGGAIGAWLGSYTPMSPLSMASSRFPLAKLPAAVMGLFPAVKQARVLKNCFLHRSYHPVKKPLAVRIVRSYLPAINPSLHRTSLMRTR